MRNRCVLLAILTLLCGFALASSTFAAEIAGAEQAGPAVSLKPIRVFQIGNFAITNSMLVTWIVAVGTIVFAQIERGNNKPIPRCMENFWEWLVEGLHNFLESIIGLELVRKTFWFFATIF